MAEVAVMSKVGPSFSAVPVAPSDVTLGAPLPNYAAPPAKDGSPQVEYIVPVTWPAGTITEIRLFLDLPDSASAWEFGQEMGGQMAPPFSPIPLGSFVKSATIQPRFTVKAVSASTWARLYAVSGSVNVQKQPIRYGLAGVSPNIAFQMDPPPAGPIGREYVPNVAYVSNTPEYRIDEAGNQQWRFTIAWTWPTTDQNYAKLGGVDVDLNDGTAVTTLASITPAQATYTSPWLPIEYASRDFRVRLVSWSLNGDRNTYSYGVTPECPVFTVARQVGVAGIEYAPLITLTSLTGTTVNGADGTAWVRIVAAGTVPSDASFGGAVLYIDRGDGAGALPTRTAARILPLEGWFQMPATAQTWVCSVVSIDTSGRANTITGSTPQASLSVGSASGQLNLKKGSNWGADFDLAGATVLIGPGAITTPKLSATAIDIGGVVGTCPLFRVKDSLGSLFAWIGDNTGDANPAYRYVGAWFKQFRAGGSAPDTAPIQADSSGNVTINGAKLVVYSSVLGTTLTIDPADATQPLKITNTAGYLLQLNLYGGYNGLFLSGTNAGGYPKGQYTENFWALQSGNNPPTTPYANCTINVGSYVQQLLVYGANYVNLVASNPAVQGPYIDLGNYGIYMVNATQVVGPRGAAVADPTGGSVVDVQCRAQLAALLNRLRAATGHGLIA